jgi:hypothetical protein
MGRVAKEYITKLGCEKYFRRVTYILNTAGDALRTSGENRARCCST